METINLEGDAVAYILGRDGCTKRRLENCTQCRVEVGHDKVDMYGTSEEIDLCKICIG